MTEETMDLLVRPHIRRMKKRIIALVKKENLTQEQVEKRIKKFAKEAGNAICEDYDKLITEELLGQEAQEQPVTEKIQQETITENETLEPKPASIAIEVSNLWIHYKTMGSYSVKKMLLNHKKNKKETFSAVRGVNFTVNKGEILGIIGKNGSGKSTMLRAIAGIFSPDQGSVDLKGNSISLLSIGVGFKKELTGRENIVLSGMLLGFSEQYVKEKIDDIIEFSELGEFIDRPVRTYSSGMYSKLAFSITSSLETDIILIDEVLSVGDEKFRKKSMNRMKELINEKERTVVIVSHSISTLKALCDKVMWVHEGEIRMIGKPAEVLAEYKEFMK
jgi:teichoic acid transport system ATP-binding protein